MENWKVLINIVWGNLAAEPEVTIIVQIIDLTVRITKLIDWLDKYRGSYQYTHLNMNLQ